METLEKPLGALRGPDDYSGTAKTFMGEPFGKLPPRISKLAEALAKAQSEFTPVVKDKTANIRSDKGNYSYKFADLSDILKMAMPVLSRNGLALSQPFIRKEGKLYVTTRLLHTSGEVLEDDGIFVPENIQPQQFGSYVSYYRRFSASSLLAIAPDEDTDEVLSQPERAPAPPPRGRPRKEEPVNPPAFQKALDAVHEAVQKPDKRTEFPHGANEPAPAPKTFQADDSDIPDNIGTRPEAISKEERGEYARRLRDYKVDMGILGSYVKRTTGVADTKDITKQQWIDLFRVLDGAKDLAALQELIK